MEKCLLLLLVSLIGAQAGPLNFYGETQCATSCPDTQKFSFVPGRSYEYRYESDATTSIPGATEEVSALHMTATVRLEALSTCEMALSLDDVTLMDSDPRRPEVRQPVERSADFKRSLERRPMRFAFVNGRVENVCPSSAEETWVVNLKRGIVSAIQNNMHDLNTDTETRETDISGYCDVSYKVGTSSWGTKAITKTKDLMSCSGRHYADTILQAVHYDVPSKLQSLPIIRSTQDCEQQVNSAGIIARASCKESHVFRPFSRHNSGATTEVAYTLAFTKEGRTTTRIETIDGRQSLKFDHTPSREDVQQNYRDAEATLRGLCDETTRDVRPETPDKFNTLLRQMKVLDAASLQRLHQMSSSGSICQTAEKFFHDALPTISTEASVSLMAQLIRQGEPGEQETQVWLNSLAFVPTVTKVMLSEVKPILEMQGFSRKAALSISSLVNSYCRENPECGLESEVREIITVFERNLAYNCQSEEHDKVLMSLKAIGNTGHAEQVVPTLNRCFTNAQVPMEIRVEAVKAFRRMACTADRSELESTFRNREIDSELRINAYLALMQCPTEFLISTIRRTLENEDVNQVGSFIWTHLTNLMETSSPFKQQARLILDDTKLQKEFDLDKRKFSRNIEKSVFSEMLNSGASIDSNLIWSTKSFVPRSASVNLTVDIFGQAINLVEVGGRVQGLDGVLERLFSANKEEEENIINLEGLDQLDKKFREEREESPQGSYFVRIFGNEIRYDDFHGFDLDSVKEKFNYLQWLIELAKTHEFDYTKSTKFLDTTITIPTAIGLPFKLSLDGTAVLDIKVNGKMDIRNLAAAPRSMDISGYVKPSAAVQISSQMGVDAWIASTGLKMTNTFHTSTVADGTIQLQDGKMFKFELNMPKERMEIFDFQSKFFISHRNMDREQRMIQDDRFQVSKCTGARFEKITGIEFCGTLSYPDLYPKEGAPWFPFNGPISATVTLNKKDTYDKITFEAALMQEKDRSSGRLALTDIARLSFNTPGSRINRELLFDFALNRAEMNLNLNVKSPWSQAQLTGSVRNERDQKRISTNLVINRRDEYGAVAQVQMDASRIVPTVELTMPGKPPVRLGGSITNKNGRRLIIDLTLENAAREPVTLKGTMVNKKWEKMTGDIEMNSPWMNFDINSYMDRSKGSMDGSVKLSYQMAGERKYRLTVDQSYRHAKSGATSEINYSGSYSWTRRPGYNADITLKATKGSNSQTLSLDGGLSRDKTKRLTINQEGSLVLGANKAVNFDGSLKLPIMGWNWEMSTKNAMSRDELTSTLTLKDNKQFESNMDVTLKKKLTSPIFVSADASLRLPGREIAYRHSLEETSAKTFDHKLYMQWDANTKVEVNSMFKAQPRLELTGSIKTPINQEPIMVEGHLKPDLKEFQSYLLVQVAGQPHSLEVNWQHTPNRAGFNTEGTMEFQYQQRKVISELKVGRKGTNMYTFAETKWDALRNERKMVSITGEVEATSTPTIQMKAIWWPRHFVEVNGNFKYQKTSYFTGQGDTEGALSIKSSIRGYEDMSATFQIESKGREHKYHYDGTWNRDKINIDAYLKLINELSNLEFNANVETPFQAVRTASAEIKHELQNGQLNSNGKVTWNKEEMSLELNGRANLDRHLLSGSATFKSPFQGYEQISVSGRHSDDGSNFQSELQGQWSRQRAAVGFTMSHKNNGWFIENNGEISVTTPFREYRTNKLSWSHKNDRDEFKPHIELEIGSDKSVFEIDATSKKSYRKYKAEVKSFLNTPYFNNLRLDVSHEHDPRELRFIKSSISTQWARDQVMSLEYDATRPSSLQMIESWKFLSPFRGFERVSLDTNANFEGPIVYSQELKWGNNKKIAINANGNYKNAEFQGQATFSSPWTEVITVTGDNKMESGTWVSSSSLEYSPGRKMELSTRFSNTELKRLRIDFKSLCPYMRNLLLDLEHRGSIKQFESKVQVNHNFLKEPITADIKFDIIRLPNIETQFNIKTPFESLPFFGVVASHQSRRSKHVSSLTINNPFCQITASNDANVNAITDFNTRSEIQYCGDNIKLATQFNAEERVSGMATLKTPFTEDMSVTFNHQGELNNFQSSADASYGLYKKVTTTAEFKKYGSSIQGSARISSPIRNYETVAIQFNHRGRATNFRNDATVEIGSDKISGNTEFSFRGDKVILKASAVTPVHGFESMTFDLSHDGDLRNFKQEASLAISDQRIYLSTEFNAIRDIMGKLELRTPFRASRTVLLQFNHAGVATNFQNSGSLQINSVTYSANSAFTASGDKLEARASVKVPEEYSILINHQGPWDNFNNRLTIDMAGDRIDGESKFALNGYNVDASATLKTPFRALETATATYKYAGYPTNFQTQAAFQVNRLRTAVNANFNKRKDNLSGKLELSTSFRELSSFIFMFDHSGSLTQFENSGSVDINGKSYTGTSRFSLQDKEISGFAELRLPEEYRVEFTHKGGLRWWKNNVDMNLRGQAVSGYTSYKWNRQGLSATAGVNTPFRRLRVVDASVSHSGDMDSFENSASLRVNSNRYSGSSQFQRRGSDISGSATLNLPDEYGISFNHNGDLTEFTNSGAVKVAGVSYTGRSEFTRAGRRMRGSTSFRLPEEYGLEFTHEGHLDNFNNEGALTYGSRKYTARSSFSRQGGTISGSATINTPDEYSVSFSHQGDRNSFSNEGNVNLAGKRYSGETSFSHRGTRINGKAQVNIPEEYSINLNHEGGYNSFANQGNLNIAGRRYSGETSYNRRGSTITGKAQVNIPDEYSVNFNHEGNIYDFKNDGIVKLGRRKFSGRSSYKRSGDQVEAAAAVNVPEEYGFRLNHVGGPKAFTNNGELKINRNVYSGSSEFRLDRSGVEGKASVRVPEEYAVSFKHQGPATQFNNQAEIKIPGRTVSANTEFTLNGRNIAGQATVRLPQEYGVSFSHQGPLNSFNNEATIRTPERAYTGNSELRIKDQGISGTARVNLPREYSVDFSHDGPLNNFNSKATVTYANRKYAGNTEFLMKGKKAQGRVVLRIPDLYSIKFNHQGDLDSFSNDATIKAFGQKYAAASEFRMNGDTVRGTANVRIPEEYKLTFSHNGRPADFNTNAEAILNGASYTGTVAFKKDGDKIESNGQIQTPHHQAKSLEYRYSHQGDMYNFKQDAHAAAGSRRFSAKTEYNLKGNNVNGRVEIATPFQAARTVLIEVSHEGKLKNFKNSAALQINDQRYTANGEMDLFGKKKQGSILFALPKEYGFSFVHKGKDWKDWTNKATASFGDDKINVNSGLTIEPTNVEALLSVRTPFRAADSFGFNVNHKGNSGKFTTQAEVITPVRGYRKFAGEINFEGNGRSFQTNGKFQTPFDNLPEATFNANHRSQLNNYVSSAAIEMGSKRLAGESAYRRFGKNLELSLKAQTPFRNWEEMGFSIEHSGEDNGFKTNIKLDTPFREYKSFGANFDYQGSLRNFQTSLRLETPFDEMPVMTVAVNHRGDSRDFTSSGRVRYGTTKMDGQVSYKRTSTWDDGSHIAAVEINTPFRAFQQLYLSAEQHFGRNALTGKLEAGYNGRKYIDGDYTLEKSARKNVMINIREPQPMAHSFIFEKKSGGFEAISNFNWDTRQPNSNGRIALNLGAEGDRFFTKGEFFLANVPNSKIAFEVENSQNSRRYQSIYDGRLKLESAMLDWEGTYNHIHSPGRRYVTDVRLNRKLRVQSEVYVNQPGVKATVTVAHPALKNDVVIGAEGQIGGEALFDGKASLAYADQKFEGTAKFMDKSQRNNARYSTEWHLTHPGSFLDVTFKSEVGSSNEAVTGNMEVNYMTTRDRQMKTMSLRSEINKIRDELNMEIVTPLNNMRMTGRIMPEERGKQQIILTGNVDNKEVRAELELNKDKPGADLKLYQNDKMIHVYGKYMDRSMVQIEAYRQIGGLRVQEAQLAVRLNNSRLLHARAYLRPDLVEDLQEAINRDFGVWDALNSMTDAIAEELRLKGVHLDRALRPILDVLEDKAELVARSFRSLYRRNDFYIRDITDYISSSMDSAKERAHWHKRNMATKAREWNEVAQRHYRTASDNIKHYSKYATGIAYDGITISSKYINDAYTTVMSHPRIQTIRDTSSWQMLEAWWNRVVERATILVNEFWSYMDQYPQIKSYLESYADYLWDRIQKLKYCEMVKMLDEITRLTYDTIRDRIVEIVKEYSQIGKTKFIVWDPIRGEFQVEIHLPLPLKDLRSLPHTKIQSYLNTIQSYFKEMPLTSDYNMWDTYYAYKPTSDITDWVPPFKAHATIAGNQNYMTFDKRFYEFAGECSYLLARDFIDGKFSVIVNYDKVRGEVIKKSISVISGNKNIEIFPNFKVNVDGAQTELPIVAGHTYVSREGNFIKVTSAHGMKVTCDLPHDKCTVDVTGWYYGKTGGLFGTYDNEPSNDFTTADRTNATTPEQLADSWTVGRHCRVQNHVKHVSEYSDPRRTQICAKFFRDQSSPFRRCFRQVDNEAFMHMCLDEMPQNVNHAIQDEDVCNVAAFYVDECRRTGVPLTMPEACVSCELESGEKFSNTTLEDEEVPQSSDIVLVVSHRQCNSDLINRLDNIVSQIDSSLREQGIRKPRFSLTGFGGEGPLANPHSHTMEGEIFHSKYKFPKAMQNFEIHTTPSEDALEALEYAARLPFRAGVSKSIILIPCDTCTEQAVNYADVQRLLFQRDIRLHVLTQQDFQLKADKSTSYIFGADRNSVFTNKDVGEKEIQGDTGLRGHLIMPKDLCVALTEESQGSVFNSLKLVEGRSVGQKKFLDVLSRVVASKGVPSDCQICDCVADRTGLGQPVCKACSAPSLSYWSQGALTKPEADKEFEEHLQEYLKQPRVERRQRRQRKHRRD